MNITPIIVATLATIFVLIVIGAFILYAIREKDKNPAQWKTVKQTEEWIKTDPETGEKVKCTRSEFSRVRV